MIWWSETDWLYRFLIIVTFASVAHLIFVAPQDFEYGWITALLIGVTFVYHHILIWKLSLKRKQENDRIHEQEPRLKGEPTYSSAESISNDKDYELLDIDTGNSKGKIRGHLLSELIKAHEDWNLKSNDFYILIESLDMLESSGYSRELVSFLRELFAGRDSIEVRWVDDKAKQ